MWRIVNRAVYHRNLVRGVPHADFPLAAVTGFHRIVGIHFLLCGFQKREKVISQFLINVRAIESDSFSITIILAENQQIQISIYRNGFPNNISGGAAATVFPCQLKCGNSVRQAYPSSQVNDNLEATAQAIYKSWFTDCEPFELDNKGSPIGWIKTTLDKKLTTSTQSINPQKLKEEYVWHYSIPAYDNEHLPTLDIPSSILSNKYLVPDNAILVSKLNPDTKRIWRVLSCFEDAICSTEFIVFSPKIPSHRAFYYLMFNSKSFIDFLVSNATGSTNSRMRVKPASSLDYEFLCPDNGFIDKFCDMVEPLLAEIEKNTLEIRKLNELIPVAVAKMMTSSR